MDLSKVVIVTARVRSTTGGFSFHRRLSVQAGEITPSTGSSTSTGPMSFLGGTPVTGLRSLLGGGTPSWGTPQPGQDGVPPARDGIPPARQVMLQHVMPRAVRLLRFPAGGLSCSFYFRR